MEPTTAVSYGPVRLNAAEFTRRRLDAGWSIQAVAARTGIPKTTLFRHIQNERVHASPVVVAKLSALFPGRSLWTPVDDATNTQQ